MRIIDDTFIIGIDSGYGNIKTANCCFPASVAAYDTEPVFKDNMTLSVGGTQSQRENEENENSVLDFLNSF